MSCDKCGSDRLVYMSSKSDDRNAIYFHKEVYEHMGYVLSGLGIGSGDYLSFNYCLECGKIQGDFPISKDVVKETLSKNGWERDGN